MADGAARLREAFAAAERPLLVPYMMGGFPTLGASRDVARALGAHADILEIGIAFSDPLADGPTVQAAGQVALDAGVVPDDVIALAGDVRDGPPVVLMTCLNLVMAGPPERFMRAAADAGVAGLIVSDLPCDEGDDVRAAARQAGVAMISLVAPTTTDERLADVAKVAEGFVYCVSVTGVTGGAVSVDDDLAAFVARVKRAIPLPVVVGFGVQTPEHAAAIGRFADGVVVGSQLVRAIERDGLDAAAGLAGAMAAALRGDGN
ncbi:MAG: tryptophan synthase subunit alpha [Thermoleophilia bacterium]|nr:tryptophan synthase subunit alpha [Thermoleophilia bacterium]